LRSPLFARCFLVLRFFHLSFTFTLFPILITMLTKRTASATASAAGLPGKEEDSPCCWLCLEEGPDASGKPLVRDCSCRGTSGFAHLSCAVKYAENKSRQAYERDEYSIVDFFVVCPNCKQNHQGDVEYDMAKTQVEFIEREYKNNHMLYLDVLVDRINTLFDSKDEQDRPEREVVCSKMLSIIEEVDKDPSLQHDGLTHSMATAHHSMGVFRTEFGSKENLEKAKEHYERAKDLYEMVGEEVEAMTMECNVRVVVAKLNGNEVELDMTQEIIYCQKRYNYCVEQFGESGLETIKQGVELAIALYNADHAIEAERFLTKLAQICRRVHGTEHNITEKTLAELQEIKVRQVYLSADHAWFQALRYENDGEKIVVQGPLPKVLDERNVDEEKTLTVESNDIIPMKGTPVVVHSQRLRSMSHLNGKIGDIRAFSKDDRICEVHFEEEGLGPTKVRRENVRILFELPEKK
jgi:hypothetical protein